MNTRKFLPISLAIGILTVVGTQAQAADLDQVTVSAPATKTVGYDPATLIPIQEVTVTAHVLYDPVWLTTNSGVALLNDSVIEAARKSCYSADPTGSDDGTCVRMAIKNAQPQIAAAIARARSSENG
jgi:UrcA family protein